MFTCSEWHLKQSEFQDYDQHRTLRPNTSYSLPQNVFSTILSKVWDASRGYTCAHNMHKKSRNFAPQDRTFQFFCYFIRAWPLMQLYSEEKVFLLHKLFFFQILDQNWDTSSGQSFSDCFSKIIRKFTPKTQSFSFSCSFMERLLFMLLHSEK